MLLGDTVIDLEVKDESFIDDFKGEYIVPFQSMLVPTNDVLHDKTTADLEEQSKVLKMVSFGSSQGVIITCEKNESYLSSILETEIQKASIVYEFDRDKDMSIWDVYDEVEILDACIIEEDAILSSVVADVHEFDFDSSPIYDFYEDKDETKEQKLHEGT